MKIKLLAIGKTDHKHLIKLIEEYEKRLKHYVKFELAIIPDVKNAKNLSEIQQKEKEGELILSKLQNTDVLVLLDDKGKQFTSIEFSKYLLKKMNAGIKQLVLGGLEVPIRRIHKFVQIIYLLWLVVAAAGALCSIFRRKLG